MKQILSSLLPALGLLVVLPAVSAQTPPVTVTVQATLAPNAYGSPSFPQWAANGLYAAQFDLSSFGGPGPTEYDTVTAPLPTMDNIVTGFPSWLGQADPTGLFASELGNRASFTVEINGNGGLVSISEMGFSGVSSDPGNLLGQGFVYPDDTVLPGDWTYDQYDIGVVDGPGNTFSYITSGPATQMVNEIISIGAGNAYPSVLGDDPDPLATDQQTLDYDLAQTPANYDFTGTFTYGDTNVVSGAATFEFVSTPDSNSPAADALILAGMVFAGLALPNLQGKKPTIRA